MNRPGMVGQFRVPTAAERTRLAATISRAVRRPAASKAFDGWQAMVLSDDAGSPPTLTVNLGGTEISGVRYLKSYVPVLGEKVELSVRLGDVFVLGALAT